MVKTNKAAVLGAGALWQYAVHKAQYPGPNLSKCRIAADRSGPDTRMCQSDGSQQTAAGRTPGCSGSDTGPLRARTFYHMGGNNYKWILGGMRRWNGKG
jgi:hypothetical protein